jgi:hypothetical protein
MLLVTFHGGSSGIPNVYAYDTTTNQLNTTAALVGSNLSTDSELRGLVWANSYLYVVNGTKRESTILCFHPPAAGATIYQFQSVGTFLSATFSHKKDHFENSVAHPYALVFDGQAFCYVSNQDTNVVAQATVASGSETASLQTGCQSTYLQQLTSICPTGGCVYLDGTFVASQIGLLPDVAVATTSVPSQYGGLSVSLAEENGKQKVHNSVRDLAIAGNVLFVCDEPSGLVRLYSLPGGDYLGSSATLPKSPTHLTIASGGLFVSAGDQVYWSALGSSPSPSSLCFASILTVPSGQGYKKIGGLAFDSAGTTAWVAFQTATGTTGSGAIYRYTVQGNGAKPPVLIGGVLADNLPDTPEFVLFVPDPPPG